MSGAGAGAGAEAGAKPKRRKIKAPEAGAITTGAVKLAAGLAGKAMPYVPYASNQVRHL